MAGSVANAASPPMHEGARKRRILPIVLAAVLVIVLLTVVLGQVFYGVFSGPPPTPGPQMITTTFGSPSAVSEGFQVAVTNVSQALGPGNFKVNFTENSTAGTPAALAASVVLTVNGSAYTIAWVDAGGEGTVNESDRFEVTRPGGLPVPAVLTFSLLWSDARVVQAAVYTTTVAKPVINFGNPIAVTDGFEFSVAGSSRSLGPGNYMVNLEANSSTGTPVPLAASMSLVVGGRTYSITWTDVGGEGVLNGGDRFRVTSTGGVPTSTVYVFYLLWSDGSVVQTAQYTTEMRPAIAFGSPTPIVDGFQFSVVAASRPLGPGNYRVNLDANSTTGTPVPMAMSMSIVVGPRTYSIAWVDLGGEGFLNAGDQFWVTTAGGLPASTVFTFYLLWSDGAIIQTAVYRS